MNKMINIKKLKIPNNLKTFNKKYLFLILFDQFLFYRKKLTL